MLAQTVSLTEKINAELFYADQVTFWRHHIIEGFQPQYTVVLSNKGKMVWSSKGQSKGLAGLIEDEAKKIADDLKEQGWKRSKVNGATHGAVSFFWQQAQQQ